MATSTFDVSDSRIVQSGRWEYAFLASQRALVCQGTNSTLDFTATGTDCSILWAVTATGTNYLQVSVDGGAFTNLTVPGSANTYTSTTLFTGLSDAAHTVTIRHNTGTVTNSYFQAVAGLSVTGAAPALAAPSASLFGAVYRSDDMRLMRHAVPEGVVFESVSGGMSRIALAAPDAALYFRGNPTSIKVFAFNNSAAFRVIQDGVPVGSLVSVPSGSAYAWLTLATGLDGSMHDYHIAQASPLTVTTAYVAGVNLVGGDFDTTPANLKPRRAAILFVGDSITAGVGTSDSTVNWPRLIGDAKGYQSINMGVSGIKCLGTTSSAASAENANPTMYAPNVYRDMVKYVTVCIGHNDNALANLGTSNSEYRASLTRLLTKLKAAYPDATALYVVGPPDTAAYTTTVRDNLNADCSAAATAVGGWTYVRTSSTAGQANYTDGAFTGSGDMTDGTHPNSTGATKLKNWLIGNFATAPALAVTPPAASDVRSGTDRGDGVLGALAVPSAANVLNGVPVDAGAGTYVTVGTGSVKTGVPFGAASALTGTYDGSDRWTDPGEANVKTGTAYKANSTSNNKTGTYDGSDRWTDPGVGNVRNNVAYKANSTSNNRTGTDLLPAEADVNEGVEYGAGGTEFTGTLTPGSEISPTEIATAVRNELAVELARIDVATSTRASQTSVDGVPTAAEVRQEMDANSTRFAAIIADTEDIQSRLPDALVNGNMKADTQRMNGAAVQGTGTSGDPWRGA